MSIQVHNFSKLYGRQRALDHVSFSITTGEIVGFLGPNGAGKSTMMKIITCYIPPSEGSVKVCGFDIAEQSIDVRRQCERLGCDRVFDKSMEIEALIDWCLALGRERDADTGQR